MSLTLPVFPLDTWKNQTAVCIDRSGNILTTQPAEARTLPKATKADYDNRENFTCIGFEEIVAGKKIVLEEGHFTVGEDLTLINSKDLPYPYAGHVYWSKDHELRDRLFIIGTDSYPKPFNSLENELVQIGDDVSQVYRFVDGYPVPTS